ncbi:MAG: GatB/YqeY domain-containing protein [Flavobacteriales bacterium]|nr:GatB/YqeY domain-containing protein [Flavobacteriales bacterium]
MEDFTARINADIKAAMLAKDKDRLEALRAAKSALMLLATEKGGGSDDAGAQLKSLKKLVKQRVDAAEIYLQQGREDLAKVELFQADVLKEYLPEELGEDALAPLVQKIIDDNGATSMADMGKVMGKVMGELGDKADGKLLSSIVKKLLQ